MRYRITFRKPNGSTSQFPGIVANSESEAKSKFLAMSSYRNCTVIAVEKTGN